MVWNFLFLYIILGHKRECGCGLTDWPQTHTLLWGSLRFESLSLSPCQITSKGHNKPSESRFPSVRSENKKRKISEYQSATVILLLWAAFTTGFHLNGLNMSPEHLHCSSLMFSSDSCTFSLWSKKISAFKLNKKKTYIFFLFSLSFRWKHQPRGM